MADALDTEILADSPLLYWDLADTSRGAAADRSPNGRNGAYNGLQLLRQPGVPVGGYSVRNGGNGFVSIAGAAALCPASLTVEVFTWLNVASTVLFSSYAAVPASWELGIDNGGFLYFKTDNGATDQRATDFRTSASYTPDTFIHVVGSCDATHINLYANGWSVAATNIAARSNSRTDQVRLGARAFVGAEAYSTGFLARAALYNTVLSASRIEAHWEASGLSLTTQLPGPVNHSATSSTDDLTTILHSVRKTY